MEQTKNLSSWLVALFACAALVACLGLAGCGDNSAASSSAAADSSSAAAEEEAAPEVGGGFEETPIFEDVEAGGWLNVSAVYFQPVPMTDGSTIEGKDIHLEADIHALAGNKFGFGEGDWVPYMTVSYKVTDKDNKVAAEGTFMEMSASDGPHYGANIALPDAGTYTIEITIGSPADNNYLLHTDAETGPGASSFDDGVEWPLVVTETWDYVPLEY
ncbi:MAG: iron transporter [Coriobacteriia bacterium]|nr:iron transporter [Coriobacteriia bacterium]